MTARSERAAAANLEPETVEPAAGSEILHLDSGFDQATWEESRAEGETAGAGGRAVLGWALIALALLWMGFTAWSAGRALAAEPVATPALAQWVATAAGPLALLALAWLTFGRTRRRETERFMQTVVTLQTEARSLEALLQVLGQRLQDSRSELTMIAQHLMQLGDETTGRLGGITRELDSSAERLGRHGEALDRAAESARTDIAVLLDDLPRAESSARAVAEQLRTAGAEATGRAEVFARQVESLSEQTRAADETIAAAAARLGEQLGQVESAGETAATRIGEADSALSRTLDQLLDRTTRVLEEIRSGIDAQAAAVTALVDQASAGIGRVGIDSATALGGHIADASTSLDGLSARVAEQERASQRMIADIDRGLTLIDERFTQLAASGDERANRFLESLERARGELEALAVQSEGSDGALAGLAERTAALRDSIAQLDGALREQVAAALGEAEGSAERLRQAAQATRPEIDWMRDAAAEASARLEQSEQSIAGQQDRLAALLASLDDGVGTVESRLSALASAIAEAQSESQRLESETAPALVAAMVQVREAAAHAADRAREAIAAVIPEGVASLSSETRSALERAIREGIEERLREVDSVAARAVESALAASDRLTRQMLTLGQSAAALEEHIEKTDSAQREKDSEAFARRVSLLIDSMHSAAIDVGKILSDEIDDKAWESYLKGNRGVFTRRAVRLLDGSESRAIRAHYDSEPEFQRSVNRYVHDFEAMLRRVLAERDGAMIAVTLMGSDMGKLYAALAQAIGR